MELFSTPYVIRELQIKTKMRYHYTVFRMGKSRILTTNVGHRYGATELSFTAYGMQMGSYVGDKFGSFL